MLPCKAIAIISHGRSEKTAQSGQVPLSADTELCVARLGPVPWLVRLQSSSSVPAPPPHTHTYGAQFQVQVASAGTPEQDFVDAVTKVFYDNPIHVFFYSRSQIINL